MPDAVDAVTAAAAVDHGNKSEAGYRSDNDDDDYEEDGLGLSPEWITTTVRMRDISTVDKLPPDHGHFNYDDGEAKT